jgi:hypothetical protein
MCLRLRERVRYVKTMSAWHNWLKWYQAWASSFRLYDLETDEVSEGGLRFRQRIYSAPLREERLAFYNMLMSTTLAHETASNSLPWSEAGTYYFDVDGVRVSITFTEAAARFADIALQMRPFRKQHSRDPIELDLDALHATALSLDEQEKALGIEETLRGNWSKRLKTLEVKIFEVDETLVQTRSLNLDGLFHLVGALGVGKSTLIWLVTYHLAHERGYHVTVMVNTVVESIRFASWLRRLGVKAAPILGKKRADHEQKYGLANTQSLDMRTLLTEPETTDPALAWMPAPCTVSGGQLDPFSIDNACKMKTARVIAAR